MEVVLAALITLFGVLATQVVSLFINLRVGKDNQTQHAEVQEALQNLTEATHHTAQRVEIVELKLENVKDEVRTLGDRVPNPEVMRFISEIKAERQRLAAQRRSYEENDRTDP